MANALFVQLGPFFSGGALVTAPKLYHYNAGLLTDKDIWSDRGETTPLAQPFIGDANGILNFFGDGLYKFVIKDSEDNTLYTLDNVLIDDVTLVSFEEGASITSASTTVLGVEIWAHITGTTTINAFSGTGLPWFWAVFDGSLTITHSSNVICPGAIDLTVQAGDVILLLNEGSGVFRVSGQMPNSLLVNRTDVTISVSDARTNSVDAPFTVSSTTSGTPASGIGTGVLYRAESQDESPCDVGRADFVLSDVTAASEDSYFQILLRVAGAALTACYRFVSTTAFNAIVTHANTADRTYTLPDETGIVHTSGGPLLVSGAAPSTPVAGTIYRDSLISAWASVEHSAGTPSISLDVNISSLTDHGAGDYTLTFATALSTANYAVAGMSIAIGTIYLQTGGNKTTSACRVIQSAGDTDFSVIFVGG